MRKIIYLIPLVFLGITGCEDVIDVPLNESDMDLYVVDSKITTIDAPYVFLSKSMLVTTEDEPIKISDAEITLTDDALPANIVTLVEDLTKKGYYTVPEDVEYVGVEGRKYTLSIVYQGDTLIATDYLSRVEPIDSINIRPSEYSDNLFLAIAIYSQETPGYGNYYKWEIYVNDTFLYKTDYLLIASDDLVDGNYIEYEVFTDFHDPSKEEDRVLNLNDTVYLKQISISKMAYDFYTGMLNQYYGGSMFSPPPANVKGNFVSNDGKKVLGKFTAQDVSISNTVIIDEEIESQLNKQ